MNMNMIIQSNSDRSIISSSSSNHQIEMGMEMGHNHHLGSSLSSSCCSLQSQMKSTSSFSASSCSHEHSDISTLNHTLSKSNMHTSSSSSSQSPSPFTLLSIFKNAVLKCIQSSYHSDDLNFRFTNVENAKSTGTSSSSSSSHWLQLAFLFFFSMKMQLLFEHSVCIISLIITRHLASKKKVQGKTDFDYRQHVPLVRTASSIDETERVTGTGTGTTNEYQEDLLVRSEIDAVYSQNMKNNSTPKPSAIKLRQDSQLSAFTSQTWSQQDIDNANDISATSSSSILLNEQLEADCAAVDIAPAPSSSLSQLPRTSSFLSNASDESGDEWGQFTDFNEDDDGLQHAGINEDPFMSINRTILKKRGDKMPFHKLDQLQEEDEHEEDDQ